MKKLGLLLILAAIFFGPSMVSAQGNDTPIRVEVRVESAFVRVAPSFDAEEAASVFDNDPLEVVGRNLDGTWFEVRRPGRLLNLGWLFNEMVEWDFAPETLPLTDLTTGVLGPAPLENDPGFAIFVRENVAMRSQPFFQGERLTVVPHSTTVPLLERNLDGSWLRVNYLGYDGWIIGFPTRSLPNILDVPEAPGLQPLETVEVAIIPPEIQLAQAARLREFLVNRRDLSAGLEGFWWAVYQGEIVPCNPPAFVTEYIHSDQDVRELPELQRYVPRANEAIDYLNGSIAPLQHCGVIRPDEVIQARNGAINARIIFDATLDLLDRLVGDVIR